MRNRIGMRWRKITGDRWAFGGWVVLGMGLVLLSVSIPFSIWLIQRPGEVGPNFSGSLTDTASFADSAKLEIHRNSAAVDTGDAGLISGVGEEESVQDLPVADVATFSDTTTLDVQEIPGGGTEAEQVEPEPTGGGAAGTAHFSDSAQFIVRDSGGNIKDQGVVE